MSYLVIKKIITPFLVFKWCKGCGLKRACGLIVVRYCGTNERTCRSKSVLAEMCRVVILRDQV